MKFRWFVCIFTGITGPTSENCCLVLGRRIKKNTLFYCDGWRGCSKKVRLTSCGAAFLTCLQNLAFWAFKVHPNEIRVTIRFCVFKVASSLPKHRPAHSHMQTCLLEGGEEKAWTSQTDRLLDQKAQPMVPPQSMRNWKSMVPYLKWSQQIHHKSI